MNTIPTEQQQFEYQINLTNNEEMQDIITVLAYNDNEAKAKALSCENNKHNKEKAEIITKWKV